MDISTITVKQGRRAIDSAKVRELANSMNEIGLINPITVTPDKVLITGAHRLEAARLLGWTDIQATVSQLDGLRAELAEIDENLMRNELHFLDSGNLQARREDLLREIGVRASVGRPEKNTAKLAVLTTADIAEQAGMSERTFYRRKQLAKRIIPEAQEAIKEADCTQKDAEKIANLDGNGQRFVAQEIARGQTDIDKAIESWRPTSISMPHVSFNSGENEWYTPIEFINAAREVMGSIGLDPASCEAANKTVKATKIYTINDDGLKQHWHGNVWLNPPYASDLIGKFADKVAESKNDIQQAIILVNNATETGWFNTLISVASAVVFPKSRVKFYMADGKTGAPLQGQAFIYVGDNPQRFLDVFKAFGWGATL